MSRAAATFPITTGALTRLRRTWHIYQAHRHLSRTIDHLACLDEESLAALTLLFRANEAFPRNPRT